jgi:hypothetical protein
VDDVARAIVAALRADPQIAQLVGTRIGPEEEGVPAKLPAITYLLTSGAALSLDQADAMVEEPRWKLDIWTEVAAHLQPLADRIDAVLRRRHVTTSTGRRIRYMDRESVWIHVPDPDARHWSSTWSMVTI